MEDTPKKILRKPSRSATCCILEPGSVMAIKCRPIFSFPSASCARAKKYCLKMLGSSVEPDLLATMKSVRLRSTWLSMDLICAGSVESSTCSSGWPACWPKVIFSTSGQRLEPPIPSSRAWVKWASEASVAAARSCDKFLRCSSTTCSQPTHLSSSSLVHRDLSPRQRRAIFWLACQSFSVACTACASGAANCQRGGWMMDLVLTLFSLLLYFLLHSSDQLGEGIVKELDTFDQNLVRDFFDGDTSLLQIVHGSECGGEICIEAGAEYSVDANRVQGLRRDGVHCFRADQLFNVENVTIFGIFCAG